MSLNRYLNILEKFDSKKNHNANPKKILILSIASNDFIINCSIAHVLVKLGHQVTLLRVKKILILSYRILLALR